MSVPDIILVMASWLVAFASLARVRYFWQERERYQRALPDARALRQELEAAGRWEQALRGDNQALQRRLDDAEDEARHYREALKVQNIHNAAMESKEQTT